MSGPPFQRQLLELAGLSADSIVDAVEHPHVTADVLVVPAPPAMSEVNPPWAVQWLRDRLLPRVDLTGPRQRIYVTRGPSANNRTVLNDDVVTALLESRGFVLVDPGQLTVAEQIRTFANADVIVATHGAALANLTSRARARQSSSCFRWAACCPTTGASSRASPAFATATSPRPGRRPGAGGPPRSCATSRST